MFLGSLAKGQCWLDRRWNCWGNHQTWHHETWSCVRHLHPYCLRAHHFIMRTATFSNAIFGCHHFWLDDDWLFVSHQTAQCFLILIFATVVLFGLQLSHHPVNIIRYHPTLFVYRHLNWYIWLNWLWSGVLCWLRFSIGHWLWAFVYWPGSFQHGHIDIAHYVQNRVALRHLHHSLSYWPTKLNQFIVKNSLNGQI